MSQYGSSIKLSGTEKNAQKVLAAVTIVVDILFGLTHSPVISFKIMQLVLNNLNNFILVQGLS